MMKTTRAMNGVKMGEGSLCGCLARMFAVMCVCGVLAACDNNDGPMERAGERIDKAATDIGNAIEDKCEEAKKHAGASDTDC
jgi:hypothetical protein